MVIGWGRKPSSRARRLKSVTRVHFKLFSPSYLVDSTLFVSLKLNSQCSQNPEKEDIYRLGVILVEVITGRPIDSRSELDDLKFQVTAIFIFLASKFYIEFDLK